MTSGKLPSIEELTGLELREIKRILGAPLTSALETDFEMAVYAFVWAAERRSAPGLTHKEVLGRPFIEVLDAFREANDSMDPTNAGSGEA